MAQRLPEVLGPSPPEELETGTREAALVLPSCSSCGWQGSPVPGTGRCPSCGHPMDVDL